MDKVIKWNAYRNLIRVCMRVHAGKSLLRIWSLWCFGWAVLIATTFRSWILIKQFRGFSPIQATRIGIPAHPVRWAFDFCSAKADLTNLSHKPRPEGRGNWDRLKRNKPKILLMFFKSDFPGVCMWCAWRTKLWQEPNPHRTSLV